MVLKNNRAPRLSNIKLSASFHHHMWIQTGITVRKRLSGVMTSVTLTFDLDLLLSLVMTPENFMMIRWWEHSEKGVTDGQTDRQTERSVLRAAWSQQKIVTCHLITYSSSHWSILFHKDKTKKSEPLTKMWAMMWLLSAQMPDVKINVFYAYTNMLNKKWDEINYLFLNCNFAIW